MRQPVSILLAISAAFLGSSCAATNRGASAIQQGDSAPQQSGISYYLPKTLLEVGATRTPYTHRIISNGTLAPNDSIEIKADLKVLTVSEKDSQSLDLPPGALRDGSLTVSVSPEGFLQGINSTSQGKSGEFLSSVLQIVGRVIAFAAAGAAAPGEAITPPNPYTCTPDGLPNDIRDDAFQEQAANQWRPDKSWFGTDEIGFYFVTHSNTGCAAWKNLLVTERATRRQEQELRELEASLIGRYGQEAEELQSRIRRAETLLRRIQAAELASRAQYEQALKKFKSDYRLTPKAQEDEVITAHEFLKLEEIPVSSLLAGKENKTDIQAALSGYPKMLSILSAGVFLASDDLPALAQGGGSQSVQGDCSQNDVVKIFYREPRFIRIAIFEEKDEKFRRTDERLIKVFSSDKRCIGIRTSNWANRTLVVEFGEHGVPKSLQRMDSAALAAAASGISAAVASLQNTYSESLQKLVEIEKNRRELAQSDLLQDIAVAQREKELLDARVALEGASASQDLVVQQQVAQQRLTLLQRELALAQAQQGYDPQLELAALKDRLAILEQQLAVLEAEKKLEEAQKPQKP